MWENFLWIGGLNMTTITKIEDIKEAGKWLSIEAKVIQIWDTTNKAISQTGIVGDETGAIKIVAWKKSGYPPLELGETYKLVNVATSEFNDRFSVSINKNTKIIPMGRQELEV